MILVVKNNGKYRSGFDEFYTPNSTKNQKQILFSHYKMENLLKQIVNNTKPKRSFSIVVSDNKTRFKSWFNPPIQLDKKKDYEIAFINLETYYSFPNIDKSDNCFTYSQNLVPLWFDIIIPEGSYHVEDINEFIQREMRKKLSLW